MSNIKTININIKQELDKALIDCLKQYIKYYMPERWKKINENNKHIFKDINVKGMG